MKAAKVLRTFVRPRTLPGGGGDFGSAGATQPRAPKFLPPQPAVAGDGDGLVLHARSACLSSDLSYLGLAVRRGAPRFARQWLLADADKWCPGGVRVRQLRRKASSADCPNFGEPIK